MKVTVSVPRIGQLDGESCQPEHIPQPAVVILAEALIGFGRGQAVVERFGDRHRQLEADFFGCLGHIHQDTIGDGLGAGVSVDDRAKEWVLGFVEVVVELRPCLHLTRSRGPFPLELTKRLPPMIR